MYEPLNIHVHSKLVLFLLFYAVSQFTDVSDLRMFVVQFAICNTYLNT